MTVRITGTQSKWKSTAKLRQ